MTAVFLHGIVVDMQTAEYTVCHYLIDTSVRAYFLVCQAKKKNGFAWKLFYLFGGFCRISLVI